MVLADLVIRAQTNSVFSFSGNNGTNSNNSNNKENNRNNKYNDNIIVIIIMIIRIIAASAGFSYRGVLQSPVASRENKTALYNTRKTSGIREGVSEG